MSTQRSRDQLASMLQRIEALIDARFPQIHSGGRTLVIEEVGAPQRPRAPQAQIVTSGRAARFPGPPCSRWPISPSTWRSSPRLGEAGIEAVTTNLNINFLAKPEPRDLMADVRLIRLGRRLAVGEAQIYSDGIAGHGRACHRHLCAADARPVGLHAVI